MTNSPSGGHTTKMTTMMNTCGTVDELVQHEQHRQQNPTNYSQMHQMSRHQMLQNSDDASTNTIHDQSFLSSSSSAVASETGTALNYLTNASSNDFKKTSKSQNPSIGEMSLGEDMSLEDLDYIEDVASEQSRRNNNNNNNRIVKIIKRHLVVGNNNGEDVDTATTVTSTTTSASDEKRISIVGLKRGSSSQGESENGDNASNRALAGDLASMTDRRRPATADSSSINANNNNNNNRVMIDADLKSNYTINSYEKTTTGGIAGASSSLHVDAYSVSIVSDTDKSINPSMTALVGSIK